MDDAIKAIVTEIQSGMAFDAHFVIDTLIRNHGDVYLNYATTMTSQDHITRTMHSQISRKISRLEGTLTTDLELQSWSYNIRGNVNECKLWRRN